MKDFIELKIGLALWTNSSAHFWQLLFVTFGMLFLLTPAGHAQDAGQGDRFSQVGVFMGRVLPNGVDDEDEIFAMWGGRYSGPMSRGNGYYDFGFLASNSAGVDWKSIFLGLSMHIPVETLVGHAGVGFDLIRLETSTASNETVFAGHFVGGVITRIGGNVLARADMKMTTKPGTTLFFGLGLVIELDGFGSGQGGQ